MPRMERDRILARIVELELILQAMRSDDVRETLQQALADCMKRLAELNAQLGIDSQKPG
jgi:hypothetical protein